MTSDTLQPRPETETLVEMALEIVDSKKIIDIGTGSGAIAITLKLENPELDVLATDISEPCLAIAQKNAKKLKADVAFTQTNLVSSFNKDTLSNSVLCCNLPYVPSNFTINQAAMFEPEIAIFGGADGLDYYRQLFDQLRVKNARPTVILAESLPTQHKKLESIAAEHKFKLEKTEDFIQLFLSQ